MVSRPKVDWRIPSNEWQKFLDYIHDKYGDTDGYIGQEVVLAMREWIDADEYADIEDKIDRLVRAAGRTPDAFSENKISRSTFSEGETTKVRTRVDPVVKDEFRAMAKQTDDRVGIQLAKALRARREGGRSRRVEEKLDRVVDDAEGILSEMTDDSGGLNKTDRQAIAIANHFNHKGGFTRSQLHEVIVDVTGRGTKWIRDKYTEKALERLDQVPHPNKPEELFIPKEERARIQMEEKPAVERKEYDDLTRDEKVRGIQIELARDASTRRTGKSEIIAQTIKDDVFNSQSSEGHTYDLMRQAANDDGFYTREKRGVERVCVDLLKVDSDLLEEAGIEESGTSAGQPAGKATATDGGVDQ